MALFILMLLAVAMGWWIAREEYKEMDCRNCEYRKRREKR